MTSQALSLAVDVNLNLSNTCATLFYSTFSIIYSMLASKLNMTADNAERWIVNLIREARLDAKIDAKKVSNIVDDVL